MIGVRERVPSKRLLTCSGAAEAMSLARRAKISFCTDSSTFCLSNPRSNSSGSRKQSPSGLLARDPSQRALCV